MTVTTMRSVPSRHVTMAWRFRSATATLLFLQFYNVTANMNGEPSQCKIANGNALSNETHPTDCTQECFDVCSPLIEARHSEVFWRMQEPVPLPDAIQQRFSIKIMATVGYEIDQVRVTPSGDVPVPMTWACQHHCGMFLLNAKKAKLVKVKAS